MNIEKIEGIGPKYAKSLAKAGVKTTARLLKDGGTKKGRQMLAEKSGLSEVLILEWVNLADLMRIKGVGEEYSDLLEEAGVDSVKELKNRVPANLCKAMEETNKKKKLVRRTPSLSMVERWVAEAKKMPAMVSH